ncbi:MAG: FecR domain-containing protein [Planctomycetes bacterium]|nr:FecR domain-containing protein [Planctomycetota bacterium]
MNQEERLLRAFHLKATHDAGSIPSDEHRELLHLVSTDVAIADALADDLLVHRLLRQAANGVGDERFVTGVTVRVKSERDGSAFLRRVERCLPARRRWPWLAVASVAAAACLLVTLLIAWPRPASGDLLVVSGTTGETSISGIRAGTGMTVSPGAPLTCGADGQLALRVGDGSVLTLIGTSYAEVERVTDGLALRLERGTLTATVALRPSTAPLRVRTPHGEALVLGTRFTLTVGELTTLTVDQGRVRLTDARDGTAIEVIAGGRAMIGARTAVLRTHALAWYDFNEGSGNTVRDHAGRGTALDLLITDPTAARWLPGGGLRLERPTRLLSSAPAKKIAEACRLSGELTIVAAIEPDAANTRGSPSDYPKRLVSLTAGLDARDVSLSQGLYHGDRNVLDVRLRTSASTVDGKPSLTSAEPVLTPPRRLVVAFSKDRHGACRFHVDGQTIPLRLTEEQPDGSDRRFSPPAATQQLAGDLSAWALDMPLVVGAEREAAASGMRAWLGTLRRIAIFDRVLSDEEHAALARWP